MQIRKNMRQSARIGTIVSYPIEASDFTLIHFLSAAVFAQDSGNIATANHPCPPKHQCGMKL
jgi:hypothetical protein